MAKAASPPHGLRPVRGDHGICAVANTVLGSPVYTGYIYDGVPVDRSSSTGWDADGTRIAKGSIHSMSCDPTSNGFQTLNDYVLGPSGEQVTEMSVDANNSLAWQHTNVYAAGSLIGTYDTTGLHFYFNDPLGRGHRRQVFVAGVVSTRRAQTDYAGVLEQTCASLPFGDGLTCTGSTTAPTEHHFTGKERDTESGNDYFPARYYASSMGRFMSPDPYNGSYDTSNPQSMNRYVYAMNNPLSNIDPSGLECVWDDGSYDSNDDPETGAVDEN